MATTTAHLLAINVSTADVLQMSDLDFADYTNAMGFDAPWDELDEPWDEFRDDRGQWADDEDDTHA